jgi:hypothetical protein
MRSKHEKSFFLNINLSFTAFISAVICIFSVNVFAQSEAGSASLEGVVRDQNGAVVQGAAIKIKNTETGLERSAVTNTDGAFSASVLPVGNYTVTAESSGFQKLEQKIVLSVGETTPVEIVLFPQGATVQVTVTDSSDVIDTETAGAGSSIERGAIENLPIRGRNYTEFVQLTPAVVQEGDRSGLVIAGQRSINSNVALDGADFNDALQGNQRGGNEAVFFFPQTAIREFQVVRAGATAEVGRTNAGFVNAVTKSGTNETRGEVFYFNRNDRLTSADAFGNDGANNQNLFGGSIGGAIKKDKAFYFFGIEQNLLEIPYFVDFTTPAGVVLPASLASLEGERISTNNPTSLFGRTDFNLNQNNTLNFQYTYSRFKGNNFSALDEGFTLTDRPNDIRRTANSNGLKASLVSVFSPRVVNEFRFQFATDNRLEEANVAGPELRIDGIGLPGNSNGRIGGNNSRPRIFETERTQFSDNLSYDAGKHRLKFGYDVNINRFEARRIPFGAGSYRFQSSGTTSALQNFINQIPRRLEQTILLLPEYATAKGYQREYAFFVQDKFKASKNLTLTAGLRWEGLNNPNPPVPNPAFPVTQRIPDDYNQWQPRVGAAWDVSGDGNSVVRVSSGIYTARTPSVLFIRPFVENGIVSKFVRVDERSAGNCRISTTATNCLLRRNPDGTIGSNFVVAYPNLLSGSQSALAEASRQRIFGFDPNFRNPRSFQASITYDQKFGEDLVVSLGFLRNSTWNLQRRLNRNLRPPIAESDPAYPAEFRGTGYPVFAPFPAGRINPAIDWLSVNESTAHSDYNALTASVRRRFARRLTLSANYTFARSRDDDSNERNFDQELALNPYNLSAEAGYSKQDVRHNLNVSGVYELGYGFTLSGILITRSGFPFTPIFDNDFNGDTNEDNDRAIVNGRVVGRNTFRQPKFFNLDMRLLKDFRFGEKSKLSLSAEVFNLTKAGNRSFGADAVSPFCTDVTAFIGANPSGYNITCPAGLSPSKFAGEAYTAPSTARFGGPRQLQLGVKFSF